MKPARQNEAVRHIRKLIGERGFTIPSRLLTLPDNQQWIIFEKDGKEIGVDTASGVWIRQSVDDDWQCVCLPCVVSGAIQAVEFLTK